MVENIPNLKETDIQVQEAQRVPNKMNPNRPTPRHISIKTVKVQERILKASREKELNYKRTPMRMWTDFSTEMLQARWEWQDIFKVLKEKNLQPRILYSAKLSFRIEGKIKNFSDKQKLKEYSSNTKNSKHGRLRRCTNAAERSYPTSKVRGRSWEDPMPEEWWPRGATPCLSQGWRPRGATLRPRSGAASGRSYLTSKEEWLRGRRRAERSYFTFKVRRGGIEEIPPRPR